MEQFIAPIANYYEEKLVNPEFKEFLNSCKKVYGENTSLNDYESLQRLAETKDERSYQYKESILSSWDKDNVERWEKIREEVLKKPTIANLTETEFSELYIEMPEKANKYYILDSNYPHQENNLLKYSFNQQIGYKCISAYSVLLPQMLEIPGVREYFIRICQRFIL